MPNELSIPESDLETEQKLLRSLALPQLVAGRKAIDEGQLQEAEAILRDYLRTVNKYDPAALHMLADVGLRMEYFANAEQLLRKAVELAPTWLEARYGLTISIYKQNRVAEALAHIDILLSVEPDNIPFHILKAEMLVNIGEYENAIIDYEHIISLDASQPRMWMSYAHNLKTLGRLDEAIMAYRRAISLDPNFGEVWWSLANLKTYKFSKDDVAAMKASLELSDLSIDNRTQLEFALGKAAEDGQDFQEAFRHYSSGNKLRSTIISYDSSTMQAHVDMSTDLFSKDFFEERKGEGFKAKDPIFIIGMHRAGSTLIEQILASHPDVEGTFELNDMPALVKQWTGAPARVDKITGEGFNFIGQQYIERTRIQRKSNKPRFVDKYPSNWQHVPFIHMVLPDAIIIDARRHPMACCFSNFKQFYAVGHAASYDLTSMGHQYTNYVRLMRHVDEVLPNRVYRVIHENLVDDPEGEIRKLLEACGLSFDQACLNFHENRRAVRTPSAEQVRRPIYREGMETWQNFDQWLEPLKAVLGDLIETYKR
jgi:tetratricopeptide (TPR) repeat protein